MISRRIIYALSLICALFFYILYPPWISWYLLVLLLLIVPLDLIISLPGMLSKTVMLSAPQYIEQNKDCVLTITTVHKKPFPVRYLAVKLKVTGDSFSSGCRVLCTAEQNGHSEVMIDTTQTGVTIFEIYKVLPISLIGLFSLNVKVNGKVSVLVMPPVKTPANRMALPREFTLKPKPGGGFSEEHDMRNYRQGDPVRSIHWKISAKYDALIIREPLVPPQHSRLVHIILWNGEEERDLILGRVRWISEYLLKWELPFFLKYGEDSTIVEIKQEAEMFGYLRIVLDKTATIPLKSDPVPARFTWVYRIDARNRDITSVKELKQKTEAVV